MLAYAQQAAKTTRVEYGKLRRAKCRKSSLHHVAFAELNSLCHLLQLRSDISALILSFMTRKIQTIYFCVSHSEFDVQLSAETVFV